MTKTKKRGPGRPKKQAHEFPARVSAAVPARVARELDKVASEERRSRSQTVLVALEEFLERRRGAGMKVAGLSS